MTALKREATIRWLGHPVHTEGWACAPRDRGHGRGFARGELAKGVRAIASSRTESLITSSGSVPCAWSTR